MLTDTMKRALAKIDASGGVIVLDKYSRVVCGGEVLSFGPVTILRLYMYGYMGCRDGHSFITFTGHKAIKEKAHD